MLLHSFKLQIIINSFAIFVNLSYLRIRKAVWRSVADILCERKVRATQGTPLLNGKQLVTVGNMQKKMTALGIRIRGKGEKVR
jgi:hypothetical protein